MTKSKRNIFFISILVIFIIAGCGNPTDKKAGVKTDVKPEKSKRRGVRKCAGATAYSEYQCGQRKQ